jgi:hypothetical protein
MGQLVHSCFDFGERTHPLQSSTPRSAPASQAMIANCYLLPTRFCTPLKTDTLPSPGTKRQNGGRFAYYALRRQADTFLQRQSGDASHTKPTRPNADTFRLPPITVDLTLTLALTLS